MILGPERYDIYRVYHINDITAKLKISNSIRSFASGIFEVLKGLPEGVIPEGMSVDTSLLNFSQEKDIYKSYK